VFTLQFGDPIINRYEVSEAGQIGADCGVDGSGETARPHQLPKFL
jgi:hypothetical protein